MALPLLAAATTFKLTPIHLGNGHIISGTVDTDGSIGYLTPASFPKWKITVTQTTDAVYNERNTSAANTQQVTSDGASDWQTPLTLNYAYLNQPDATIYTAATVARGGKNVFNITPATVATAPTSSRCSEPSPQMAPLER